MEKEMKSTILHKEAYTELLAAFKTHIAEEFPTSYHFPTNNETFSFFRNEAKSGKGKNTPTHIQQAVPVQALIAAQAKAYATTQNTQAKAEATIQTIQPKAYATKATTKSATTPKRETTPKDHKSVSTETLAPINIDSLLDIRQWVSSLFPNLLLNHIPNDAKAKEIKDTWRQNQLQSAVIILVDSSLSTAHASFLQSVAKGISDRLVPASVMTYSESELPNLLKIDLLQLILTTQEVSEHLKECTKPIIPLGDLEVYLKHPAQKRILWQQICDRLQSSVSV
jgi:hypothetical protein